MTKPNELAALDAARSIETLIRKHRAIFTPEEIEELLESSRRFRAWAMASVDIKVRIGLRSANRENRS